MDETTTARETMPADGDIAGPSTAGASSPGAAVTGAGGGTPVVSSLVPGAAQEMLPDRTYVRPLLVVVPKGGK